MYWVEFELFIRDRVKPENGAIWAHEGSYVTKERSRNIHGDLEIMDKEEPQLRLQD